MSITTNEHGNTIYHVLSTSCVFNWYRKPTIDPLWGIYLRVENLSPFYAYIHGLSVFTTNDDKIDTNFHNNIVYIWTYKLSYVFDLIWFIVFNATFSNISAISWPSVLLLEETGVPGENHRTATSHWRTWSHNVVSSTPRLSGVQTHSKHGILEPCIIHRNLK